MVRKIFPNFTSQKGKEVFGVLKKLLPIIVILFIIALAISNYFNESESENTIIAQGVHYTFFV